MNACCDKVVSQGPPGTFVSRLPQSAAVGKPGGEAQENPGLAYTASVQGARAQTVLSAWGRHRVSTLYGGQSSRVCRPRESQQIHEGKAVAKLLSKFHLFVFRGFAFSRETGVESWG